MKTETLVIVAAALAAAWFFSRAVRGSNGSAPASFNPSYPGGLPRDGMPRLYWV